MASDSKIPQRPPAPDLPKAPPAASRQQQARAPAPETPSPRPPDPELDWPGV